MKIRDIFKIGAFVLTSIGVSEIVQNAVNTFAPPIHTINDKPVEELEPDEKAKIKVEKFKNASVTFTSYMLGGIVGDAVRQHANNMVDNTADVLCTVGNLIKR